jgi:hypothetical protein
MSLYLPQNLTLKLDCKCERNETISYHNQLSKKFEIIGFWEEVLSKMETSFSDNELLLR